MGNQRFITEVWDYRLSKCAPIIYAGGAPETEISEDEDISIRENWVVCLYSQDKAVNKPLEVFNSNFKAEGGEANDDNWQEGHDICYAWLRSVRDKYARINIKDLKPLVIKIRNADKLRQKATDAYNLVMKEGIVEESNGQI